MFTDEQKKIANATCRSRGAVGKNAIIPRVLPKYVCKADKILDFGAGIEAIHAVDLREQGYKVDAWDFGDNFREGLHESNALAKKYDVVYASNVLNVQTDMVMLHETLSQISRCCDGKFIFNYPNSPRKMQLTKAQLIDEIKFYFRIVVRVDNNVYIATV